MSEMKVHLTQTVVTKLCRNRQNYLGRNTVRLYAQRSWLVTLVVFGFPNFIRYFCIHVL